MLRGPLYYKINPTWIESPQFDLRKCSHSFKSIRFSSSIIIMVMRTEIDLNESEHFPSKRILIGLGSIWTSMNTFSKRILIDLRSIYTSVNIFSKRTEIGSKIDLSWINPDSLWESVHSFRSILQYCVAHRRHSWSEIDLSPKRSECERSTQMRTEIDPRSI